jgi:hypothetical protein
MYECGPGDVVESDEGTYDSSVDDEEKSKDDRNLHLEKGGEVGSVRKLLKKFDTTGSVAIFPEAIGSKRKEDRNLAICSTLRIYGGEPQDAPIEDFLSKRKSSFKPNLSSSEDNHTTESTLPDQTDDIFHQQYENVDSLSSENDDLEKESRTLQKDCTSKDEENEELLDEKPKECEKKEKTKKKEKSRDSRKDEGKQKDKKEIRIGKKPRESDDFEPTNGDDEGFVNETPDIEKSKDFKRTRMDFIKRVNLGTWIASFTLETLLFVAMLYFISGRGGQVLSLEKNVVLFDVFEIIEIETKDESTFKNQTDPWSRHAKNLYESVELGLNRQSLGKKTNASLCNCRADDYYPAIKCVACLCNYHPLDILRIYFDIREFPLETMVYSVVPAFGLQKWARNYISGEYSLEYLFLDWLSWPCRDCKKNDASLKRIDPRFEGEGLILLEYMINKETGGLEIVSLSALLVENGTKESQYASHRADWTKQVANEMKFFFDYEL